jgi:hypothetical protein
MIFSEELVAWNIRTALPTLLRIDTKIRLVADAHRKNPSLEFDPLGCKVTSGCYSASA